ncbi:MAG: AAA family ATPase [Alphaproteobacteria bacterium]|nr:AAA family ATPase [Alphaproteobacteria bacterium]
MIESQKKIHCIFVQSIMPLLAPTLLSHDIGAHAFGVTALYLQHFRNFKNLQLEVGPHPIVLTAPNGSGKTNILEALSLFSPGRGLRSARFKDMQQQNAEHSWQVGIAVMEDGLTMDLGTARVLESTTDKRLLKYQGELLKTQALLTDYLNVVWFTPAMGSLLSDSGQVQRQFVDRLVFAYDAQHAKRRNSYDKLLRERASILKEYGVQAHGAWLAPIEHTLSELSYDIIRSRRDVLLNLEALQSITPLFPRFTAAMIGEAETLHQHIQSKEACVQAFSDQYARNRSLDAIKGSTSMGPHRAKLHVMHLGKQMPAEFCSTGEQKMLVLAIILAFVKMPSQKGLVLLLDDVVDHLDHGHRSVLLDDVMSLCSSKKSQVWMTGSDSKAFESMRHDAMFLSHEHLSN